MLPIESDIRTQLIHEERHREATVWRARFGSVRRNNASRTTDPETRQRRRNPVALKPTPSLGSKALS